MSSFEDLIRTLKEQKLNTVGFGNSITDYARGDVPENTESLFEAIVEHQRGVKFFGIPLFSGKSLLPLIDPPVWSRLDGSKVTLSHDTLENYPLPGLEWKWAWKRWHVLMLSDVDEFGWVYQSFWRVSSRWHGKYYFGDFTRKRIWVRMRYRPENSPPV